MIRAKNAMQEDEAVLRIGTSPMTPAQILVELWPKIHEHSPEIKFQLVPFDNTPENAREILANLGQNIDVVAGVFDEIMLGLRKCSGFEISRIWDSPEVLYVDIVRVRTYGYILVNKVKLLILSKVVYDIYQEVLQD